MEAVDLKKLVIAPDSFKGTMSSRRVAQIISDAAKAVFTDIECVCVPIADGGEGTVDAFGAEHIPVTAAGPHFKKTESFYGLLGDTAIIELATAAGLPMTEPLDPEITTTLGVGELITDALGRGVRKFIIALGGSSTNDCGCGMAAACGAKFYNKNGECFVPCGGALCDVERIDLSEMDPRIAESTFVTMCDIDNPLYGEKGAAYVFAPQKGADGEAVKRLDAGLRSICEVIKRDLNIDTSLLPGAGAAGGCGAGTVAFFGSELKRGIDVVLETANFADLIKDADMVVTGEGKFDSQSTDGKAISGIARYTKEAGIPLTVFCGAAEEAEASYEMGVSAVFSIQRKALPFDEAKKLNEQGLYKTAYNVFRMIREFSK